MTTKNSPSAQGTAIEWTHIPGYKGETWNPVTGCAKVSDGCKHCYAETYSKRFWGERKFTDVQCHDDRLEIPLRWKKPRAIFANSMSDLFHEDVPFEFIDKVMAVAALCPQHIFMVLTKRPVRMAEYFNHRPLSKDRSYFKDHDAEDRIYNAACEMITPRSDDPGALEELPEDHYPSIHWPLPNLWLGVSIENQDTADQRIPKLLQCPAAVRFVSYEPALGPVDLEPYIFQFIDGPEGGELVPSVAPDRIRWVIAGGESGPGARPSLPGWFRQVRDDCEAAKVPFFFKQWGEWVAEEKPGTEVALENLEDNQAVGAGGEGTHILYTRIGKKAAGHLLDGKEYSQFPEVG